MKANKLILLLGAISLWPGNQECFCCNVSVGHGIYRENVGYHLVAGYWAGNNSGANCSKISRERVASLSPKD